MQRVMLWLAPITVLGFVVLLALMYGWVGDMGNIGSEAPERPETADVIPVAQAQPQAGTAGGGTGWTGPVQGQSGGNLAHHLGPSFPAGIGNQQIQLVEQPFSSGLGGSPMQLIQQPAGLPPPQSAAQEGLAFPSGLGNQPIQLIDTTFPVGLGNGQIQLIGQNVYLGLNLSELTPELAAPLNAQAGTGLYVTSVVPTSPADRAGVKAKDILIQCDGTPVNDMKTAARIFGQKKAGDPIKLAVNRNGSTRTFTATMANVPLGLNIGATQAAAWMGADVQSIDAVMKIRFNLPDQKGVIVTQLAPGSPCSTAGLKVGDVIRRVGETRIRDVEQLESIIAKSKPGQKVTLTILRNGEQQVMSLTLGQKGSDPNQKVAVLPPGDVAIEGSWIGMDVTELSPADAADMGLPAGTKGILVSDVEGPPASVAGFQVGDVIIGINGTATPDMKQFVAATQKQPGAVVDILRGNRHMFLSVAPPGFTAQGTPLNTALDKRFRQVALQQPLAGRFAVCTLGPDLASSVSANAAGTPYILLVDPGNNAFAVLNGPDPAQLPAILGQNGVNSLICGNIPPQTAKTLACAGVDIFSGVVGSAADAISLYQANGLVAMRGF